MRQSFKFKRDLSNGIIRSKIGLVVKKTLKFSILWFLKHPLVTLEDKTLVSQSRQRMKFGGN